MRWIGLVLLALLMWTALPGCEKAAAPAKPLSADQEQKLQQQIEKARKAEGGAQKTAK